MIHHPQHTGLDRIDCQECRVRDLVLFYSDKAAYLALHEPPTKPARTPRKRASLVDLVDYVGLWTPAETHHQP